MHAHIHTQWHTLANTCTLDNISSQGLIRTKQGELVAAYAAALPYEKQIRCYSVLLENVTIIRERQRYLMLADEAGKHVYFT